MGRPLNQAPEDYARQIVADQQAYIKWLEDNQKPGGGPPDVQQQPAPNVVDPSLYEREAGTDYQGDK